MGDAEGLVGRRLGKLKDRSVDPPRRRPGRKSGASGEGVERDRPLCCYATAEDREEIIRRARQSGMSVSTFLKALALNAPVLSVYDAEVGRHLLAMEAQLVRLQRALEAAPPGPRVAKLIGDLENLAAAMSRQVDRL